MNIICALCRETIELNDQISVPNRHWHKDCFRCSYCYAILHEDRFEMYDDMLFCNEHCPQEKSSLQKDFLQNTASGHPTDLLILLKKKVTLVCVMKKLIRSVRRLEEAQRSFNKENEFGRRVFEEYFRCDLQALVGKLKINLKTNQRGEMKSVFVGRTSNGKSAVINALLGEKVLPSEIGSTTCCFIKIQSCDEDKEYVLDENGQKKDLEYLQNADALEETRIDIKKWLNLFYPKNKCPLLKNNVELIDCPGLDYVTDHDEWIGRYCADADVFVLVLDGGSGLAKSEEDFLTKVKEKISKLNVIVLFNKWDLTKDVNKEKIDKVKTQYQNRLKELFESVATSNSRSLFFVSAKEGFNRNDEGFKEFKNCLSETVSLNGLKVILTNQVDNVREIVSQITSLLDNKYSVTKIEPVTIENLKNETYESIKSGAKEIMELLNSCKQNDKLEVKKSIKALRSIVCEKLFIMSKNLVRRVEEKFKNLDKHSSGDDRFSPQFQVDASAIVYPDIFDNILKEKVVKVKKKHLRDVETFLNKSTNSKPNSFYFVSASLSMTTKDGSFQCFQQRLHDDTQSISRGKLNSKLKTIEDKISFLDKIKISERNVVNLFKHDMLHMELEMFNSKREEIEVEEYIRMLKGKVCEQISKNRKIIETEEKNNIGLSKINYPKIFDAVLYGKVYKVREEHSRQVETFLSNETMKMQNSIFFVSATRGLTGKDRPFDNFKNRLREGISSKMNNPVRNVIEEIVSLNDIKFIPLKDLSKRDIEDLVDLHFSTMKTDLQNELEKNLLNVEEVVEDAKLKFDEIDKETQNLLEVDLPRKLVIMFSNQIKQLMAKVTKSFPIISVEEEFAENLTNNFRTNLQTECSNVVSVMKQLKKQGAFKKFFMKIGRFLGIKYEYDKNHENLTKNLPLLNKEDPLKTAKENLKKYLSEQMEISNRNIAEMNGIESDWEKEKKEWKKIRGHLDRISGNTTTGLEEKETNLVDCINKLIGSLERLNILRLNVDHKNSLARQNFSDFFKLDFNSMTKKLETNREIIRRTNFKCVFVGRTSNGKSSVINALLGEKVLPSQDGCTTCCFISLKGCNDNDGYLMIDGQRKGIDYLQRADNTNAQKLSIETKVELFYPNSKCPLLKYDVELIDSPGLDDLQTNDESIDTHCKDADVFVYVINCTSGLNDSEQQFFKRVIDRVGKPNVIFLINKWDEMIDTFREEFSKEIVDQLNKKISDAIGGSVNTFNRYVGETNDLMRMFTAERNKCKTVLNEMK